MEKNNQKSPIRSELEHLKQKRCSSGAYDWSTDSSYDVTGHSRLPKWLLWCWKYDIHLNPIHFSRPGIFFMAAATTLLFYRLWPCLTSLWRHCDVTGQLNMVRELLYIILCDHSWPLFEFSQSDRWFLRFAKLSSDWSILTPSYDVTGLQNMLNWPPLGRFYDIYACLTPFY